MVTIHPIGIDDAIHVRGKHLYKKHNNGTSMTSFTIKGIAFPTPPESDDNVRHGGDVPDVLRGYNATAWLAILKKLRLELDLDFNTIRLYRMHLQKIDYSEFFDGAAALGVYVIVPLTSAFGAGVLDRTLAAPKCYDKKLFGYGATAIVEYLKYPNVLAGMVGNEVMNDEVAWRAAPCIRAYARDLKLFMDTNQDVSFNRTLPLIYAAQDSSVIGGAEMDKDKAMKLTAEYLTCAEEGKGMIVPDDTDSRHGLTHFEENKFGQSPIDIIGVNVESWCSSTQDYQRNPDGTPGSYFGLHEALRNVSVPIIFSEMGCPHSQFDGDDTDRKTVEGTRDWKQIPVVMGEMADSWSGFVAYTMDGPKDFNMMSGGPWNGSDTLTPTKDFDNFKKQLDEISGVTPLMNTIRDQDAIPRWCSKVESELLSCCDLRIFNDGNIRSFVKTVDAQGRQKFAVEPVWYAVAALTFVLYVAASKRHKRRTDLSPNLVPLQRVSSDGVTSNGSHTVNYGTV